MIVENFASSSSALNHASIDAVVAAVESAVKSRVIESWSRRPSHRIALEQIRDPFVRGQRDFLFF